MIISREFSFCLFTIYACIFTPRRWKFIQHTPPDILKRIFLLSFHNLCVHMHGQMKIYSIHTTWYSQENFPFAFSQFMRAYARADGNLFNTHHVVFSSEFSCCLFTIYACICTDRWKFIQYAPRDILKRIFLLSFHKLCEHMHVHIIDA